MKQINNILYADQGKWLQISHNSEVASEVQLGTQFVCVNGKTELITITRNDVKEVYPVKINNIDYYVSSDNYNDLVSELIRLKYTLNDELALIANSRIKDMSAQEAEFLEWRLLCKNAAKDLTNE